mmetsp:Transcript_77859/g.231965  ORF Transcript_77859/g.231965 Transcript_77859/m.231965 type:complete len:217 (-) Transcript_77859:149-799(-)
MYCAAQPFPWTASRKTQAGQRSKTALHGQRPAPAYKKVAGQILCSWLSGEAACLLLRVRLVVRLKWACERLVQCPHEAPPPETHHEHCCEAQEGGKTKSKKSELLGKVLWAHRRDVMLLVERLLGRRAYPSDAAGAILASAPPSRRGEKVRTHARGGTPPLVALKARQGQGVAGGRRAALLPPATPCIMQIVPRVLHQLALVVLAKARQGHGIADA